MANRAVFVDRDGVVNSCVVIDGRPFAPTEPGDFKILPGVSEALLKLKNAGYKTVLVTNQPDLSTGKQTWKGLNSMHSALSQRCHFDLIKVCGHVNQDRCTCRKPKPGLLMEASLELDLNLSESYIIGDRWSDVEAGRQSGCKGSFFIDYGYAEKRPSGRFTTVKSLKECVELILGDSSVL